jgi:hypothetical protein
MDILLVLVLVLIMIMMLLLQQHRDRMGGGVGEVPEGACLQQVGLVLAAKGGGRGRCILAPLPQLQGTAAQLLYSKIRSLTLMIRCSFQTT